MFVFLVRRVLLLSAVVVGISFGAFALVYGFVYDEDYVLQCGFTCENDFFYQEVYERAVARVAEQEGFNRPMVVQFADYLCGGLCIPNARRDGVIRGDFGRHWWLGRDLSFHLGITLPISAQLGFAALVVLYAIGIPLGVLGAAKRGTWIDTWLSVACTVVKSVPVFFLAPAVLIVVVLRLEIIEPPFGWEGLFRANSILHVGLMALVAMPLVVRTTRAGVIDALNQDYVRTARAKGLPERMVLRRHVMRNALTPLVDGVPPDSGRAPDRASCRRVCLWHRWLRQVVHSFVPRQGVGDGLGWDSAGAGRVGGLQPGRRSAALGAGPEDPTRRRGLAEPNGRSSTRGVTRPGRGWPLGVADFAFDGSPRAPLDTRR